MKILLVTGNYLPGKNGGIENYTHWLATLLLQNHFEVEVAALNVQESNNYIYEGVRVNNLKGSFSAFESVLINGSFDVCHFHEYSEFGGIEIPLFKKAKKYSGKVFFTFHLPYFTCYKGNFRYNEIEDCNIFNNPKRCVSCVIAEKMGYENHCSEILLKSVTELMKLTGSKKKLEKKIISKYQKLNDLLATCDQVFIYADWFKNILFENGYTNPSIKKIPYKTKTDISGLHVARDHSVKNKILFVGRIQYQKGLHLLCKAMNNITAGNIRLDVYGNIVDRDYYNQCIKEYSFNFKGTLNYIQMLGILKEYDFLILPSVFPEMYSLIIKDSFYEQLPVIASASKGNRDAIVDGANGFLFEYNNAKDLANTIDKAYQLLCKGWQPQFFIEENTEKINREILSYYV